MRLKVCQAYEMQIKMKFVFAAIYIFTNIHFYITKTCMSDAEQCYEFLSDNSSDNSHNHVTEH